MSRDLAACSGAQEAHAHVEDKKNSAARPDKLVRERIRPPARLLARAISIQICSGSAAKTATTCAAAAKLEALQRRRCVCFSLSLSRRPPRLEAYEFRLMAGQVELSQEVSVSPVVFDCTPLTEREISSGL